MTRIKCQIFGCCMDPEPYSPPCCVRCGLHYYEGFIHQEESRFWPAWWAAKAAWRWAYRLVWKWRKCDHSGKWFWDTCSDPCCSEQCYSEWIPF